MRKQRILHSILSFILILSMLITSSSLTRATEQLQPENDNWDAEAYEETEEQPEESNLIYEDDDVIIQAQGSTLSEQLSLRVNKITPQNAPAVYSQGLKTLASSISESELQIAALNIYDIAFVNSAGNEVVVGRDTEVSFIYKRDYIPANAREKSEDASVRIFEYGENEGKVIQTATDLSDAGRVKDLQVNVNKQISSATILTDGGKISVAWLIPVQQEESAEDAAPEEATTEDAAPEVATTEEKAPETASTEEVAPEETTTEEVAPEETTTEETTSEEETSEEEKGEPVVWEKEVGSDIVTVTAEAGSLPAEAELTVKAIEDEKQLADITEAIEEKAIEEKFAIKTITAYDITFYVDGEEVQPKTPVQVSIKTEDVEKGDTANVYHVDDENKAEDMEAEVNKEGEVEFEAEHFSTYVIVNKTQEEHTVTINHHAPADNNQWKAIYTTDVRKIPSNEKIDDYNKATNWDVAAIMIDGDQVWRDPETVKEISITKDTTITVYYKPKVVNDVKKTVTFYDYMVGTQQVYTPYLWRQSNDGDDHRTYIDNGNLSINSLIPNWNQYGQAITAGSHEVHLYKEIWNNQGRNANRYFGEGVTQYDQMFKGLLKDIDLNNEKNGVHFNYDEPGFFVNEDNSVWYNNKEYYRRKLYKDFNLDFKQEGDTYTLQSVSRGGNVVTTAGANFFPLDNVETNYAKNEDIDRDNNKHFNPMDNNTGNKPSSDPYNNNYYGMRYDVDFTLGDYIGDLRYHFQGDDDLWAVLTDDQGNQKVIMDIGGIHGACNKDVDIWKVLLKKNENDNVSEAEKTAFVKEHKDTKYTLTVLYMERGAGYANCYMDFVIPNAQFKDPVGIPTAELTLNKKDAKTGDALSGAEFTLVEDGNTGWRQTVTSGTDGRVSFGKLHVGTYTLTETKAPEGYINNKETWEVSVKLDETDSNKTKVTIKPLPGGSAKSFDDNATYDITNAKSEDTYIRVQKVITGITNPKEKLKNYSITITDVNGNTNALKLDEATADGNTFTWKIPGQTDGTYKVKENNANLEGYSLTAKLNGQNWDNPQNDTSTQTRTTNYNITNIKNDPFDINPNSNFLVSAFNNNKKEYLIWTADELSANERVAFIEACKSSNNSNLQGVAAADAKYYFFKGYGIGKQLKSEYYGGINVYQDNSDNGKIKVRVGNAVWNGDTFTTGTYATTADAENPTPEIKLENKYEKTFKVIKNWEGNVTDEDKPNSILVGLYRVEKNSDGTIKEYAPVQQPIELTKDGNWQGEFSLEDDSEYVVRELQETEESTKEFTIDEKYYKKVDDESIITIGSNVYAVDYSDITTEGSVSTQTITNTKKTTEIKIQKVGSEANSYLPGAEFSWTKGSLATNGDTTTWTASEASVPFTIANGEEGHTIKDLAPGFVYKLEETKAPGGFMLLGKPIYIQVGLNGNDFTIQLMEEKNGSITAGGADGIIDVIANSHITDATKMVSLTAAEGSNPATVIVRNEALYSLPSTGGSGIFVYMIGGILSMLAAAYILLHERKGVIS